MTHSRLIAVAGLVAGFLVAAPTVFYHFVNPASGAGSSPSGNAAWAALFALFGVLFILNLRRPRIPLLLVQSGAAVALALGRCNGYEGTLLVLVAIQLGGRFGRVPGLLWILGQTLLLGAALTTGWNLRVALLLVPPYLGFQVVAFLAFHLLARETAAREALAAANTELRAVQEILADSGRIAERLRIAGELHDALGHRLTALSLNLEAALRQTGGPAAANVERARGLVHELLSDVRGIVAASRTPEGVHLANALRTLTGDVPRPRIHLEIAEGLRVADPERAHVLLRCAQEIVTNAVRHSGAENLWIVVDRQNSAFRIEAQDDGRGSSEARDGFGLRGMRERVERVGGEFRISSEPGRGFNVRALVPAGETG